MAITAAQVSATRKSRATQAASSITMTAMAARVTARVRESRGSAGFSTCRSPLVSLLSMISDWGGGRRKRDGSRKATSHASRHVDDHQLRPVFPGTARAGPAIGTYRLENHHGAPRPIRGLLPQGFFGGAH